MAFLVVRSWLGSREVKVKGVGWFSCCFIFVFYLVSRISCFVLSGWRDFLGFLFVFVIRLSGVCNNGFLFRIRN